MDPAKMSGGELYHAHLQANMDQLREEFGAWWDQQELQRLLDAPSPPEDDPKVDIGDK